MARDITDGAIVHQRKWRIIHCQGKVQPAQEKNRRPMGLSFSDPRKILQSCTKMHERWSATGEQPGSSGLGSAHVGVVYLTIATRECSIHLKRYSKLPNWIVGVLWQLWHLPGLLDRSVLLTADHWGLFRARRHAPSKHGILIARKSASSQYLGDDQTLNLQEQTMASWPQITQRVTTTCCEVAEVPR